MSPSGADGVDARQAMEAARDGAGQFVWLPATADGTVRGEERVGSSFAVACQLPRLQRAQDEVSGQVGRVDTRMSDGERVEIDQSDPLPLVQEDVAVVQVAVQEHDSVVLGSRTGSSSQLARPPRRWQAPPVRGVAHGPGDRSVCCGTPPPVGPRTAAP